jgi:hypothetical protein
MGSRPDCKLHKELQLFLHTRRPLGMLWITLHLNARQRIVAMNVMSTMARTWRLTVFWRIKGHWDRLQKRPSGKRCSRRAEDTRRHVRSPLNYWLVSYPCGGCWITPKVKFLSAVIFLFNISSVSRENRQTRFGLVRHSCEHHRNRLFFRYKLVIMQHEHSDSRRRPDSDHGTAVRQ